MKLRAKANPFIFLSFILLAIAGFYNQNRASNSSQILPVAIAIADKNTDFIPDKLGDTISVAGRVTVSSGVLWKNRLQIAIQDYSGGIEIYQRDYSGSRITIGDSLQVTGIISQYRGQTQLTPIHINFIDSLNRKIPIPVQLGKSDPENYEGRLVTINGRIINISSNAGGDYLIVSNTDGSDSTLMVFNSKNHQFPDLLKKFTIGESIKITGLFVHYTNIKNYNRNYQLLPRSPEDLKILEYSARFYIFSIAGITVIAILVLFFNLVLSRKVRRKTKNLVESEQRFATLTETTTSVILIYQNGELVYVNSAAGKLANDTAKNLFYRNFANPVKSYEAKVHSESSERKVIRSEISLKNSENEMIWLDYTLFAFLWGNEDAVIVTATDITERKKTENDLRESEQKFRKLADYSPLAICIYQDDFWVYINPAGEKLSGYSAEELYQSKYWEFVAPEYQELVRNNGKNKLAGEGENNAYEFKIITKTGDSKWVILTGSSITYKDRPAGIITVFDITESKKSDEALRNANQKMNAFFEQSLDGFFFMMLDEPIKWTEGANKEQLLDFTFSNQRITRINDAMLKQYGATRDEFIGLTPNEMFGHNIEHGKNEWGKLYDQGKLHTETEERKINGEILFIEGDYTCLYDSEGRITGHFGIQRDITESRKMAKILQESESKYRYLFENNPAPMWVYDLETLRFMEVNDTAIIQYGYSREEFQCMTLKDIRPEEDIETLLTAVEQTTHSFNKAGTWRHIKKNGDIIFVEITSHQLEFQGRPARIVLINDVSERKKAEDALVESENSLRQAQIIANMGDWEFDLINNKSKWSENFYRFFDLLPNEIVPTREYFRSRVHPDDLRLIDEALIILNQTKVPFEYEIRIVFPDGRIKWIVNKIIPSFSGNEMVLLKGVIIDITAKKDSEKQLLLLSKSIEQSPVSMVITDANGTIEYVNTTFTKTTGYTKAEALGKNPRVLKSGMHEASFYEEMWETLLSGHPWIGEILNMKKDGELYWENAIIAPIFNTNGEITHFVAAKEDITEKKKLYSDLIKEKERAEESDRLKSAFLANMSHEVRTPLNSIIGFSELLADPDFEVEHKSEFIQLIISNGNNLLTIISDIMDISKLESGEMNIYKNHLNANKILSKVKSQFAMQIECKELEFRVSNDGLNDEVEFIADDDRLMQVFNNLISNALKFTTIGSIEIGYQLNDRMLEFYVRDTGIGIPAEFHAKIFDRFRQVEDEKTRKYGGNGLGLAICKNLVELMGGKIRVESVLGKGSVFYFSVPLKL